MPPKIASDNSDVRIPIAMNMMADLFLRSITRFSPLSKLPKLTAVDERLKQRALQAIQAKSPEDRKISVTKITQLGPGNLWKGLDLVPQRISKSPGNQQRHQISANQSPINPQQRRNQTIQTSLKLEVKPEAQTNQNLVKKAIQRNHNRAVQNNLNDSRRIGQMKEVTGNMVSQNLARNQKSVRDDFGINDKSGDKKRKYSNEDDKSLNMKSSGKIGGRNMTQSRALKENKEKRVSFSPQKPLEHSIDKKQSFQTKKAGQSKPTTILAPKAINIKPQKNQPYVYVPPARRVVVNEEEKTQQHQTIQSQDANQLKNLNNQSNPQVKAPINHPIKNASQKEQPKKSIQTSVTPIAKYNPQIKIKSREQILAQQEKNRKNTVVSPPAVSPQSYVYQPSQRTLPIQSKKVVPQTQKSLAKIQPETIKKAQISPKKVGFNFSENTQKKIQTSIELPKPALKTTSNRINTENSNSLKNNISLQVSVKSKNPQRQQASYKVVERKRSDISIQQMKNDWSKIKQNLKYDRSFSPQTTNRKIPQRQDIALKMLAQLFLDASTRYFPGLSMLLKRGISKEQIDKIRSKSSQFNIHISTVDRKSTSKAQPKTDRKLNWKQTQQNGNSVQKKNNRMFQGDVTATQYKIKKLEEVNLQNKKEGQSLLVEKPQTQQKNRNIVSENFQKNNKRMTRDDSNLEKPQKDLSERSSSIRQSPDVYKRETSKKDIQDSKKNMQKLKKEVNNSQYIYQPPVKNSQPKQVISALKTAQEKPVIAIGRPEVKTKVKQEIQKPLSKKQGVLVQVKTAQPKPEVKPAVKSRVNNISITNKKQQESTYVYQPPIKRQLKTYSPQNTSQPIKTEIQTNKTNVSANQKQPEIKQNPKINNLKQETQKNKPPINNNTLSNVSITSSKSQNSLTHQPKKPQIKIQQPAAARPSNSSLKIESSQNLRNVQSEKNLSSSDLTTKPQQPKMLKKQQKVVIGNIQSTKNNPPTVKQSQIKQSRAQQKRFASLVFFVLKRRINSNFAFSIQKIRQKAKKQTEIIKHASYLSRSLANFSHKYQKILQRNAFKLIKNNIATSVNKISRENKPLQENQYFSSGRKQSASRVIFWLLSSKIASFFQPLRKLCLNVANKGKVKQSVIQAMARIVQKRHIICKKAGFKAIKSYKNQRQAVLSIFAATLQRINYNAIAENFTTLVNKDIKQLAATVKTVKPVSIAQLGSGSKSPALNEVQKTLQKSKSHQILTSGKVQKQVKEQSQSLGIPKFTPAEEAKLESKRKQLERKLNDLENRKQSLQQETNSLNKQKRQKTKANGDLRIKLKELERQLENQLINQNQQASQKTKQRESSLTQSQLIPVLTRIYAYLFQDPQSTQIVIERFLEDNQNCFQLATNSFLMNEWKVINKNAQLKRGIKIYEGQQPREKRISQVLQEENYLMGKLLRSFVRERYIWEWVNIIAHE